MDEFLDQSSIVDYILSSHLLTHKDNKLDKDCAFCQGFIMESRPLAADYPLESYKFIILDITDKNKQFNG